MPERLNGTVSKTVWRFMRHEGSNPSLSAKMVFVGYYELFVTVSVTVFANY